MRAALCAALCARLWRAHLWSRPLPRRGHFWRSAAALLPSTDGKQIRSDSGCAWGFCSVSTYLSDSGCTRGPAVSRSRIAPYRSLKCRFALVLCRGGCGRRRPVLRASIQMRQGSLRGEKSPLKQSKKTPIQKRIRLDTTARQPPRSGGMGPGLRPGAESRGRGGLWPGATGVRNPCHGRGAGWLRGICRASSFRTAGTRAKSCAHDYNRTAPRSPGW